ncbi:MAG: alpha-galactosidase [Lachnospiraceae bacterium]|nr:alpha-galactosidase [Lachnospiraceae bacterium]
MSIVYNEESKLFILSTKHTEYQMKIDEIGILQHLYYGATVGGMDMSYQICQLDRGFSGNPYEYRSERGKSLDTLPQEFTGANVGDLRISSLSIKSANGSRSCDLRYKCHEIRKGKYTLKDLPYVRGHNGDLAIEEDVQSLIITLWDSLIGLEVKLHYGVFEKKDVITRAMVMVNNGKDWIRVNKLSSVCIDFPHGRYDLIHFYGRHCMERQMERVPVKHDIISIQSKRGMSSHHHNPFVILCDADTNQNQGCAYGFMMMYSGNHKTEVEKDYLDSTRLVMGLQNSNFAWRLEVGESVTAPEVIMTYAKNGLNQLSRTYHHIIRENVVDAKYYNLRRPVLINNWEATYFNFTEEKILEIADSAKELGIDMLVLDDGWFGKRNDDNTSLGDWFVNQEKLPSGLKHLADGVRERGLKFGLWFEPEMISEDSELFREHPDWAMADPERKPMYSRNQLVLDMSRKDVQDYLFDRMAEIIRDANIYYIKWDFNRSVSNFYSKALPSDRQGEVAHRFMLGTYALLDRLLKEFPELMIEGCAGGGGRFDAGMLFYCPQIWTSDDTDPVARLQIQSGTSYGYPVSTMGSHVSASPNHQTGRRTSLNTRGIVAMSGTFGYELDLTKITKKEKELMKKQIKDFRRFYWLIQHGEYYRLTDDRDESYFTCWEFVSADKSEALVNIVITDVHANPEIPFVRLQGLDADGWYLVEGTDKKYTGQALMNGGVVFGELVANCGGSDDNYPGAQYHLIRIG